MTGRAPFEEEGVNLVAAVLGKRLASPSTILNGIPESFSLLVMRMLEKDSARRPKDYAVLREQLSPFSSSAPVPAPLGLRFCAGAFDWIPLNALTSAVGFATGVLTPDNVFSMDLASAPSWWIGFTFGLWLIWFAITIPTPLQQRALHLLNVRL